MIAERAKKPGVFYAFTDDGIELPVVDVTHPAFACEMSKEELAHFTEVSLEKMRRMFRLPGFLVRLMFRRSVLLRAHLDAHGSFLSGLSTYLYKLGPDNLGDGYAGKLDRRVSGGIPGVVLRMRLKGVARLLADGLVPMLSANPTHPLHLVNIAGGPASDSINALLILRKEREDLLANRQIRIHVLDLESSGASFGARALEALKQPGAPLQDVAASLDYIRYDWSDPATLRQLLEQIRKESSIIVASSEGGLTEYGSDDTVIANLAAFHEQAPDDSFFVATLIHESPVARELREMSRVASRTFNAEALKGVAARASFAIDQTVDGNPMYGLVRLRKA